MTMRQFLSLSLGSKTVVRAICVGVILVLATAGGSGNVARNKRASLASVAAVPQTAQIAVSPQFSTAPKIERAGLAENYGKLPLTFEANQGQSDRQVQYISRGSGYTLFLTGDEALLKLRQRAGKNDHNRQTLVAPRSSSSAKVSGPPANSDVSGVKIAAAVRAKSHSSSVLRMRLVGANSAAKVAGLDEQAGKSNYFIGNDPRQWRTNVPNYSKVKYRDAYPGVDLVYYGNQRQLEYDFVVAPGADPRAITMEIAADALQAQSPKNAPLSITANGDLVVPVANSEVRFHKPVVYQPRTSKASLGGQTASLASEDLIAGRWVMKSRNRVGFELAAYDPQKPLVIDPQLSFSTYLGGSLDDNTYSIATDSSANVYVAGTTLSTDFPTQKPLQASNAGNDDAFITKLSPSGSTLVYSTYLGGDATDFAFSLAVDSSGNVHVAGTTQSTDFPTTSGAFQTTCASCGDVLPSAFVSELNSTGSALLYSTFLGGTGDSRGYGIALDSSGNAYITGRTSSTDFPTTAGALQTVLNGAVNVFVSKLNAAGSALVYSTFLGGSGSDQANGIALDSSGNAYVAGSSNSTNFPTTVGAFQTTLRGTSNGIVSKLNSTGTALVYSTYLGGNLADTAWGVRVDASGNLYVAGQTSSPNFPTTTGAFQTTCGGGCASTDAFVSKLNSSGSALVYSTFVGGSSEEEAFALAIDASGDAYVTGRTDSTDFPTTHGSFQTAFGGVYDAFVTELNPTGSALVYSTYFGGNGSDAGLGITVDTAKNVYVTGRTYSSNFATTPKAFAQTCATCSTTGYEDAFVAKFIAGDQVWPLGLNFAAQQVGVTSSPLTATLSNSGTATLGITGVTMSGTNATEFAETNTCGTSLAAGATCTVSVTFTPAATGARVATLSIADNAANNPQKVSLAGTGTNSSVTLAPTSLTFATQLVGTSSPAQNAILTNTVSATVNIGSIVASGQFSQTNKCGTTLAATANCTISVVFQPTGQGTQLGSVKVTDDAAGSPQTVTLTGSATVVSLTPGALNFGNQKVGTTSTAQTVTVMNRGTATLTIKKIGITGKGAADFAETNTCGTSLAAGASCTVSVTFTPKVMGSFAGAVSVADSGGGSPQSATLTGTGN